RPHVFTLLFFVLTLVLLERHRRDNTRWLFALPPLLVAWVNLHGGFVIAFVLLGCHLVDRLQVLVRSSPGAAPAARRGVRSLLLATALCLLATLVNPHGARALWFPLKLAADRFVVDHVSEFQSPNFHHQLVLGGLIAALWLLLLASKKRLGFVDTVSLAVFFALALYSARHAPLFAVVAAPIMAGLALELPGARLTALLAASRARSGPLIEISRHSVGHLWPAAAIAVVVALIAGGRVDHRYRQPARPVEAVRFLLDQPPAGRPFNDDEFGDYMIYAAWPRQRVFFDGRGDMYGADKMRDYLQMTRVGPRFDQVVARYDFGWAFVRSDSTVAGYLRLRSDWRSVYQDALATVFVRGAGDGR
ncbi:MAG: hypothetical protein JXR83_05840, partial [Deltaproteobacteria bacterium]|nr:hypothetical protein [Deltaproteobacteria bacterium]